MGLISRVSSRTYRFFFLQTNMAERRDLLSVLNELDSGALTNSRVRLLGLNTDLLDHISFTVRATGERLLPLGTNVGLLVILVGPKLCLSVKTQLTSRSQSTCFTHGTFSCLTSFLKASFATASFKSIPM